MAAAEERTGRQFPRRTPIIRPQNHDIEWRVNLTQVANPDGSAVDGTDADQFSYGEIEGRRQIGDAFGMLRDAIPGFANSHIVDIPRRSASGKRAACCADSRDLIRRCWLSSEGWDGMAAPLSQDLRRRLVQAVEAGSSAREAARRFAVSESAAIKLVRRVRETGSTAPARIGGYRKPLLAGHEELLRELVTAKGTITLAEIRPGSPSAASRRAA